MHDNKSADVDDALLDKCSLLQSQVYTPAAADELLLGNTSFDDSILLQNHPIKLEFNVTPDYVHVSRRSQTTPAANCVDIVALTRLGVRPNLATKSCVRCECMTLLQPAESNPAKRTWQGRWSKHCLCGGYWKKDTS